MQYRDEALGSTICRIFDLSFCQVFGFSKCWIVLLTKEIVQRDLRSYLCGLNLNYSTPALALRVV